MEGNTIVSIFNIEEISEQMQGGDQVLAYKRPLQPQQ
jgi:hypothetical protein